MKFDLKRLKFRLLLLFSVVGPGIIAANADNDAGGVATYSIVGAHFGTSMLWVLFILTFILAITQEMGVRIGLVTRQGLSGLIRENFGVRWTAFAILIMFIANIGTIAANIAGIAAAFSIFGISKYIVVPIAAVIIWLVLYKGSFKTTQKIFLIFSAFYIVYIINGFMLQPDFGKAFIDMFTPSIEFSYPFLFTLIALIGTTLTPWGQFFIQSYVVDKGLHIKDYKAEKTEVYLGALMTNTVSFFIIISTAATLFVNGIHINDAADAAIALHPIAGNMAKILFAFGLLIASMLGAFILPSATAYSTCEAFGWESGFNKTWKTGKFFYTVIFLSIFGPAALVLIPGIDLIMVMVATQALNGILLPFILIFVLLIINKKELMGKYKNKPVENILAWITIISIIIISGFLVASTLIGI
jgi:NRAMP (natural resistance-associated macrophage protein)-like metal ion transporter